MKHNIFYLSMLLFFTGVRCCTFQHENELLFFDVDFDRIPAIDINFPLDTDSTISFTIDHELNIKNETDSKKIEFPLEVCISFTNVRQRIVENKANSKEMIYNNVPTNRILTNEYENFSIKGLIKNNPSFYVDGMIMGGGNYPEHFSILIKPQYFKMQSYGGGSVYQLDGGISLNIYDSERHISQDIFIPVHRLIVIHKTSEIISNKPIMKVISKHRETIDIKLIPQTNIQLYSIDSGVFVQKNIILHLGAFNQDLPSDIKNDILKIPLVYFIKNNDGGNFFVNKMFENNQDSFISAKIHFENRTIFYKIKTKKLYENLTLYDANIFNKSYLFSATSIIYIYTENEKLMGYIVFPVLERLRL